MFTEKFSRTTTFHPGIFLGRALWGDSGELTHVRRRRRGRRLVKAVFLFYFGISFLLGSIQCVCRYKNLPLLNMLRMRSVPNRNTQNLKQRRICHFTLLFLQRMVKKCTKNYNARAQLLLCSLNLLFSDVLVAVAVVFCVRSLVSLRGRTLSRYLSI